jgi:putative ABC transport system permease protein
VGAAAGGTLALALLVCGSVFAAMAGPAVSLHLRTEALHQALTRPGPLGTAIEVSASWNTFTQAFTGQPALTEDDLSGATSALASGFAGSVPIAAGGWGGLTTTMHDVLSGTGPLPVGYHPELEVTYREQLSSNVQVIAGRVADAAIPPGVLGVAVTQQTAARYSLHPGSRLKVGSPVGTSRLKVGSPNGPIDLLVTAVVRARNPASTFWAADPLVTTPDLTHDLVNDQFSVLAGALADPGQLAAVQSAFCPAVSSGCDNMQLAWEIPVAVGEVNADRAQAFASALAVAADSPYSTEMQSVAPELAVAVPMTDTLTAFIAAQTAVLAVLLLLFASLAAIVVVVILLAARIVVARRDDELVMLRHRGASSRQIAMRILAGIAPAVIPAAVAGAALVLVVIPGTSIRADWKQAAAVLAIALAGPPLIASWRYRRPSPAINPALILTPETRTRRASVAAQRRLVAGLMACTAAVGGLVVLRGQGVSSAGVTNWYLTAAPILVAVPAALIAMRLYPLAIRALLPVWRRRGGVAGYIGLAGAVERRTSTALPAFTLVLALTLAAFGGMVNGSIVGGQITYSWQATGADAVIDTNGAAYDVTPAVEKSIMAIPGVRHATAVWTTTWQTPEGQQQLNMAAVDPAGYATMTADTPFPRIPVNAFGPADSAPVAAATVISVLASPSAAAVLGTGTVQLTSHELMGPIRIRVAGIVARTPAEPAGGMFLIMPLRTLPGVLGRPTPNLALITGTDIDRAKLSQLVTRALPPATLTFRSDVLNTLGSAPLQHAAARLMTLTAVIAAGLALLNLIFGLALGARDRELILARLNVMGYERDTRLVLLMALPAVLAAFAAAAGCALALPVLVGPALDLSVFTGTGVSVAFRPDLAALGMPCVVILVLIAAALIAETSRSRRHGVTGLLRVQ